MEGWIVCVEHQGRHGMLEGHCVLMGADVPRPTRWFKRAVICDQCGQEQDVVKLPGGRTLFVTAGTDQRHFHPADHAGDRLESVATGLDALQATLAAMLEERRQYRAPRPDPPPPTPSPPRAPAVPAVGVEIPKL